ncbi:hypothetical protein NDU88_004763 [Pleurodeles waltl]|uniref:MHC class I antigen n=1 Tax=Pleurodeles waltl TaxID=8319 RepID=A0AAV7WAP4_PLEWA|nr:hypothetical protein NDU88_004763 [Pleurodeles waltl]
MPRSALLMYHGHSSVGYCNLLNVHGQLASTDLQPERRAVRSYQSLLSDVFSGAAFWRGLCTSTGRLQQEWTGVGGWLQAERRGMDGGRRLAWEACCELRLTGPVGSFTC